MKTRFHLHKLICMLICSASGLLAFAQSDVGVVSVVAPPDGYTLVMGAKYQLIVRIKNYGGSSVQNIPVKFAVGLNATLLETCLTSIAAGATYDFTFTDSLEITNTFSGVGFAQTELVGDAVSGNDKLNTQYYFGTAGLFDAADEMGNLILYPNPTADQLTISCPGSNIHKVSIYNLDGQLVVSGSHDNGGAAENLNVSELESGVYLLEVISEDGAAYRKFVK